MMIDNIRGLKKAACISFDCKLAGKGVARPKMKQLTFPAMLHGSYGKCVVFRVTLSGKNEKDFFAS